MPTLKAIRRRIASVKSTQQVTGAMKLVAAARLRRAQESLINARPYSEALVRVADSVLGAERDLLGPAESAREEALIVVVASDRGLCGGYNTSLLKLAEEQGELLRNGGLTPRFFAVGRRAADHFRRQRIQVVGEQVNNPRLANVGLARALGRRMLSAYQVGEVREVGIVYSRFRSALSQRPVYERLLPLEAPDENREAGGKAAEGSGSVQAAEYLVEPDRERLIPQVLRSYIEAAVFHALLEAEASEQGARMTAMDSATKNATDMIQRLTLEMNRTRQAQITRELMDIVGGAEALRG
jgi:F-type H+-transporting ATPase subunit gamma